MIALLMLSCAGTPAPPATAAPEVPAPEVPAPEVPAPEVPAPEAPAAPAAQVAVRVHMTDQLTRATEVRDAVVQGDLDRARDGFQRLAEAQVVDGLPEASREWVERVRAAARAGAEAPDLRAQAMALGELANTCGGCHQSLQTGPQLVELPAPSTGQGLALHMARHAWVNDRMWVALVAPSGEAWERSLRVLSPEGIPASDIPAGWLPEGSEALDQEVRRLAWAALEDDNPDTRADLYGQIVGQCASCHELSAGGGAP